MNSILSSFNKAFEHRIRLGIMSLLMVNEALDFNALKSALELSDGNLASHLSALEKLGYIQIEKRFIGKKPNTQYQASADGKSAFKSHIQQLEQWLQSNTF